VHTTARRWRFLLHLLARRRNIHYSRRRWRWRRRRRIGQW
jgi:hypothetical protein